MQTLSGVLLPQQLLLCTPDPSSPCSRRTPQQLLLCTLYPDPACLCSRRSRLRTLGTDEGRRMCGALRICSLSATIVAKPDTCTGSVVTDDSDCGALPSTLLVRVPAKDPRPLQSTLHNSAPYSHRNAINQGRRLHAGSLQGVRVIQVPHGDGPQALSRKTRGSGLWRRGR